MMACEICKKPKTPLADDSFDFNEKPHVCSTCGRSYSLKIQLKRHILSHESEVPYICSTCEKHLERTSGDLKLPQNGGSNNIYICDVCNRSFSSKRLLSRHASEHTLANPAKCDECGECFKNNAGLKRHSVVHKRRKGLLKDKDSRKEASHVCNNCGKSFSLQKQLERHQLTYKHKCDVCDMHFTSGKLLEKHKGSCKSGIIPNKSSSNSNDLNSDDKKHVCSLCNQSFTRKSALEGHIASHFSDGREDSPVEDDSDIDADFQCPYKSDKVNELPKRQCLVPKLKIRRSFPCKKCDFVCATKKSFDKHVTSHEKIPDPTVMEKKNYTCRICNETFDSKENYKKHKLSHNSKVGEQQSSDENPKKERKNYTCQLCGYLFNKRRHLRRHIKCHFNVNDPNETSSLSSEDIQLGRGRKKSKDFSCSFCGKRFAGETCLKKHEAKHSGEDCDDISLKEKIWKGKKPVNLICDFCKEDFTGKKHSFTKHRLSHTPEVCGICDARFVDRASLREHCKIHIGTEEGRRFLECSQKALDAKNGVVPPEPKVEYIYLVLR